MKVTKIFTMLRLLCAAALLMGILPAQAQSACQSRAFSGHEERVSAAYIAYYGRPADTGGLSYWAGQMTAQGGNLGAIIDAFGNSAEYRQRFGNLSNRELIRNLYQQLYGRDPDMAGWAFYEMWLDTGVQSLASIAISIMDGTQGGDTATLDNRKTVARHFITRMEALGAAAPAITDGSLLANLMAATDGSTASRENACAQVNTLIEAQSTTTTVLTMAAHEAGASGAINNLSGAVGSERYFKLMVPAGVTDLVIRTARTAGGMGDVDLYVSRGVRPAPGNADCSSGAWFSADEQCSFATPVAGEYFILLRGAIVDYSGVTLSASWRGSTLPPEVEVLTGYLYDSAVAGVQYRSCGGNTVAKCIEGLTGLSGEFKYTQGQQVEFLIGGLRIGVAQGQQLVTPGKLSNGDSRLALQIAQLLQSLDEDQDPSNGIVIPESVRNLAVGEYPNGQDVRFVNNSQVLSKLAPGRALVSLEQVSAHAQGASLLDVMLANDSPVIPKAILGTNMYPTTGKINYEALNRSVHARLRLALFQRKMLEEQGLISAMLGAADVIREIENNTTAWINKIEAAKARSDLLVASYSLAEKQDGARALEALAALVVAANAEIKVADDSLAIKDEYIESAKAIVLKSSGVMDSDPRTLALSFIETLKAGSSASGSHPAFKRALEGVATVVECSRPKEPVSVYQCTAATAEVVAKGLVEAIGTGQLMIAEPRARVLGAALTFMLAYYQSAGNPVYMRERHGIDFFAPAYDAQNELLLGPGSTIGDVYLTIDYLEVVSRWMAEIEREAKVYESAFNLKYAGLLDLKATGIENGGVVPTGTAVDFEATFKNMTAGNYTVRSINWVASGTGSPTVVAAGTRANVRFHSAGNYRVAAHAEVLLPDGQTYFMVDSFTVVVQDAAPVPALTLAATPGDGYVDLSWNAIPGATAYKVHMATGVTGPEGLPAIATTSATHYRVSGLQNGTLYRFTARAFRGEEVLAGSRLVSATPAASGDADIFGSIVQLSVNTSLIGRKLVGDGTEFFIGDSTVVTAEVDFDNNGVVFVYKKNGNFAAGDQKGFNGYLIEFPDSNFILKNVWINNHLTSLSGMAENHVWVDGNIAYLNVAGLRYRVGDVLRVEFQIEKKNRDLIAGRYLPIEGGSVIRDTVNKLEWQRCSVGQTWNGTTQRCDGTAATYNWDQATQLTAAGGFRIPTSAELKTLVYCSSGQPKLFGPLDDDVSCSGNYSRPTVAQAAFPNTRSSPVWSGSPYAWYSGGPIGAWLVDFSAGEASGNDNRNANYPVRLVRGGQSFASLPIRSANLASVNAASLPVKASPGVLGTALANFTGYDGAAPDAPLHSAQFDAIYNVVFFLSRATNLLPGAQGGVQHLYGFNPNSRLLLRLSQTHSGEAANADTTAFDLAAQAGKLVFRTQASNLEGGAGLYLLNLDTHTRKPLLTALQHGGHDLGVDNPVLNGSGLGLAFDAPDANGRRQIFSAGLAETGLQGLQAETPLSDTTTTSCCAALSADGRYLAWQETGQDGRVRARVLVLATEAAATLEWPQTGAAQGLRMVLSADGAQLRWLAQSAGADATPMHSAANPLYVPAMPLR